MPDTKNPFLTPADKSVGVVAKGSNWKLEELESGRVLLTVDGHCTWSGSNEHVAQAALETAEIDADGRRAVAELLGVPFVDRFAPTAVPGLAAPSGDVES